MTRFIDGLPITQDINIASEIYIGDPVTEYSSQTLGSHPSTLVTHTVNTGKIFLLYNWSAETEGANAKFELQLDGTAIDSIRFVNSADTNRITVNYGSGPKQATAGQVVRVRTISGGNNKEFTASFNGIEVDA